MKKALFIVFSTVKAMVFICLSAFCFFGGLLEFPSLGSLFLFAAGILMLPVPVLQSSLNSHIFKTLFLRFVKGAIIFILFSLGVLISATSDADSVSEDKIVPSPVASAFVSPSPIPATVSSMVSPSPTNMPSSNLDAVISDSVLAENFEIACNDIGLDFSKISGLEKVEDWANGPRYSFSYMDLPLRLYANMDSSVNCIKLNADTDIYKQGYEPYQISDYIVDTDIAAQLRTITEEHVISKLNYPSSADFPWFDWSYGRERDVYVVSSSVEAKNAFNVEDELSFTLYYRVQGSNISLIGFVMDGEVYVDKLDTVQTPERQRIETSKEYSGDNVGTSITLIDGELGEYGKEVIVDGNSYIKYFVPAGTYTVVNNSKMCTVYVENITSYKNSSGYTEYEITDMAQFTSYGETKTITVENGQQISLTIYANVTLEPVA